MAFYRYEPSESLLGLIDCYWIIENDNPQPVEQKIIPDGFPEIIFHYGDPYRIKLRNKWNVQPSALLAGQLTKFFLLENTGRSYVVGIKLKPAAITHLFGIAMHEVTDNVVALKAGIVDVLTPSEKRFDRWTHAKIISVLNARIESLSKNYKPDVIDDAIAVIFETHGLISVRELCERTSTKERQLERLFRKYIGLSPKFYMRVIRFSYVFKMVNEKKLTGAQLGLEAGFYDQPHFIKNFKAFTGEDPSAYFFDQPTLANFFLRKQRGA